MTAVLPKRKKSMRAPPLRARATPVAADNARRRSHPRYNHVFPAPHTSMFGNSDFGLVVVAVLLFGPVFTLIRLARNSGAAFPAAPLPPAR